MMTLLTPVILKGVEYIYNISFSKCRSAAADIENIEAYMKRALTVYKANGIYNIGIGCERPIKRALIDDSVYPFMLMSSGTDKHYFDVCKSAP